MKRSKYTGEQLLVIVKAGEAGRKAADLCRANGITEQTHYRRNPVVVSQSCDKMSNHRTAPAAN